MSSNSARPGPVAPPPAPADVGIVAAMPMEIGPLLARLKSPRKYSGERHTVIEGELSGKIVVAIIAGVGRKSARRGTQLLIGGHRPRWMISAGFGGALDPGLKRNQVVLADEVLDTDGLRLSIDVSAPAESTTKHKITAGRLLTVDKIIRTAAEKAALRHQYHQADLLDMETSAVAAVCNERGVRFLGVRVISDEAGVDLPPEILSIMGPTGSFRVGAAMGAIWRRPSSLKELLVLRDHATAAAQVLTDVLPGIIRQLP
jgi:adenosylhomocysteine nucleosidase